MRLRAADSKGTGTFVGHATGWVPTERLRQLSADPQWQTRPIVQVLRLGVGANVRRVQKHRSFTSHARIPAEQSWRVRQNLRNWSSRIGAKVPSSMFLCHLWMVGKMRGCFWQRLLLLKRSFGVCVTVLAHAFWIQHH